MSDVATFEEQISAAFAQRPELTTVVSADAPMTDEYDDARAFAGKRWQDVICQDLEKYSAAVFGFEPAAFCYFLPGIYCTGIREHRADLIVNHSLIGMLDRANRPPAWDTFFLERWPTLSRAECEATQLWITWLSEFDPGGFSNDSLSRAFDTVTLISNQLTIPSSTRNLRP